MINEQQPQQSISRDNGVNATHHMHYKLASPPKTRCSSSMDLVTAVTILRELMEEHKMFDWSDLTGLTTPMPPRLIETLHSFGYIYGRDYVVSYDRTGDNFVVIYDVTFHVSHPESPVEAVLSHLALSHIVYVVEDDE